MKAVDVLEALDEIKIEQEEEPMDTGEEEGHTHSYVPGSDGTTSKVNGHDHAYEAGAKSTGPADGKEDGHTHSLK